MSEKTVLVNGMYYLYFLIKVSVTSIFPAL